jgi:hypothetical protein
MIDPEWVAIGGMVVAGAVGYGQLRQRVEDEAQGRQDDYNRIDKKIDKLDDRLADLTDYLLRKNGDKK